MRPQDGRTESGKLVAFEGIDNAGKSSVLRVLTTLLSDCRVPVVDCGEQLSPIAPLLRGRAIQDLSPFLKTYFFAADRAWTYERECLPALRGGALVLWDRYVDSAIAYRTVEFERVPTLVDLAFVLQINQPFRPADFTFYVDVSVKTSVARSERDGGPEPYDPDFLGAVRQKYLEMSAERGYRVVDGEVPIDLVATEVASVLRRQFPEMFP